MLAPGPDEKNMKQKVGPVRRYTFTYGHTYERTYVRIHARMLVHSRVHTYVRVSLQFVRTYRRTDACQANACQANVRTYVRLYWRTFVRTDIRSCTRYVRTFGNVRTYVCAYVCPHGTYVRTYTYGRNEFADPVFPACIRMHTCVHLWRLTPESGIENKRARSRRSQLLQKLLTPSAASSPEPGRRTR
jgi:hypothetical protein